MHILKHLHTINKHRRLVRKLCFKCHLFKQGILHDLSKYSFIEFINGAKYYEGFRSPNNNERNHKGYSEAWMHHKGRNKHHAEFWIDINNESGTYQSVKMPYKYVVESFCDRIAASKIYKGKVFKRSDPLDYLNFESKALPIHEESLKELTYLLNYYKDHTDKETFKMVRLELKKRKKDVEI